MQLSVDLVGKSNPVVLVGPARVIGQFRVPRDVTYRRKVRLAHAADDDVPVGSLEHACWHIERSETAARLLIFHDLAGLKGGSGLHHADVQILATSEASPSQYRCGHGLVGKQTRECIDDDHAGTVRLSAGACIHLHHSRVGLHQRIHRGAAGVRPALPEA